MTAMSDVTSRTFGDLFRLSPEELATCLNDQTLARSAQDGKSLAKWMAATPAHPARQQVAQHMCSALSESLVSAFAGAWSKYTELMACAKETREDPKSTMDVAMADHDFRYQMDSSVDILLNGANVASVPFTFAATCKVSGLELSLNKGCVVAVRSGKLDCDAEILCSSQSVWKRSLADVNLPGELHLAHPIPLEAVP